MKRCIILFLILSLLSGCQDSSEPVSQDLFAMDTFMTLTAYGSSGAKAVDLGTARLKELDGLLSTTDSGSQVYAYNHGDTGALGEEAQTLVDRATELGQRTNGALDITIYPFVLAWGFTADVQRVPSEEELAALMAEDRTMIDLGSVTKGYAGDVLAALFRENGVKSAIVSLGGNVHCIGSKPDGSNWSVAVQNPTPGAANYLGALSVSDQAVVTSGGYERNFEIDGVRYHHILDPKTGAPADSGLISVTIVADEGLLADGLSTALFVMGLEDALAHYAEYQDFEAVLVTEEKEVYVTPGLSDSFQLLDESYRLMEILS